MMLSVPPAMYLVLVYGGFHMLNIRLAIGIQWWVKEDRNVREGGAFPGVVHGCGEFWDVVTKHYPLGKQEVLSYVRYERGALDVDACSVDLHIIVVSVVH